MVVSWSPVYLAISFLLVGLLNLQKQPSGLKANNLIKKETLAQVFFYDFCEIFNKTYFYRTPLVAASVKIKEGQFYLNHRFNILQNISG